MLNLLSLIKHFWVVSAAFPYLIFIFAIEFRATLQIERYDILKWHSKTEN